MTNLPVPKATTVPWANPPEERRPWDRLPGENSAWYARFIQFRDAGPSRALLHIYQAYLAGKGRHPTKQIAGSWSAQAHKMRWRDRALAWDAQQLAEREVKRKQEEDRLFDSQMQAVRVAYGKIIQALQALQPSDIPSGQVVPQMLSVIKKLEELHGRVTPKQVEVTGPGGGPIRVDVDVRQKLLRELDTLERELGINWVDVTDAEVIDEVTDGGADD